MFDSIIIGGALSGSRTAELIAKAGYKVLLIEEHSNIGQPCKCTGLVSWRTPAILNLPKELIVQVVDRARFFAPNGDHFTLQSHKPVYVLDRPGLDKFLFDSAVNAGAEVKIETFESFQHVNGMMKVKTDKGIYETKLLIGADGGNSVVSKQVKLKMPNNRFLGLQTTIDGNFDEVELWFGKKYPKFFGWVVPENGNRARIGIAAEKNPYFYYKTFLEERVKKIVKPDVSGLIRIGLMKDTTAERILLVGDAACQMKPLSGGGITYGLVGAKYATEAVVKALQENEFNHQFLKKEYDEKWKKELAPGIKKGMLIRKILFSLTDWQMNAAFKLINLIGFKFLEKIDFDLLVS